jgi:hypothetical protein
VCLLLLLPSTLPPLQESGAKHYALKKNPLKNLGAMIKLNPQAASARRCAGCSVAYLLLCSMVERDCGVWGRGLEVWLATRISTAVALHWLAALLVWKCSGILKAAGRGVGLGGGWKFFADGRAVGVWCSSNWVCVEQRPRFGNCYDLGMCQSHVLGLCVVLL